MKPHVQQFAGNTKVIHRLNFICLGLTVFCFFILLAYLLEPEFKGLPVQKKLKLAAQHIIKLPTNVSQSIAKEFEGNLHVLGAKAPILEIFIAPQHKEKLDRKAQQARQEHYLITREGDEVPATIVAGERELYKASVRLKGDLLDHLKPGEESLRVKIKRGSSLFGMRRFSLQSDQTRHGHGELLLANHARELGIIAPRMLYANVFVNNTFAGTRIVEEHFSKELLESQQRRESVIMAFDESHIWEQRWLNHATQTNPLVNPKEFGLITEWSTPMARWRFLPFKVYQESKVFKNTTLRNHYKEALSLLRGYKEGYIEFDKTFDPVVTGKYLALVHLFNVRHGLAVHNLRFYYNPITRLFEPIVFDNNVTLFDGDVPTLKKIPAFYFFGPQKLIDSYRATLVEIKKQLKTGRLPERLREWEHGVKKSFGLASKNVGSFPIHVLEKRVDVLLAHPPQATLDDTLQRPWTKISKLVENPFLATLAHAYYIEDQAGAYLEFVNLSDRVVTIDDIQMVHNKNITHHNPPPSRETLSPDNAYEKRTRIRVPKLISLNARYKITLSMDANNKHKAVYALRYQPAAKKAKYYAPSTESLFGKFPFLQMAGPGEIHVLTGSWEVPETLIIPRDFSLTVPAGVRLRFAPNARLVVRGPLAIEGTPGSKVVLTSQTHNGNKQTWGGIVALGNHDDRFSFTHALVENVAAIENDDWNLTGAVTLHRGIAVIHSSTFANNTTEDSLNIINGEFVITNSNILDTTSDALDIDFGNGRISKTAFNNIGGDAIDVSGTTISINEVTIQEAFDKAISVGEGSYFEGTLIDINGAGTAIASKDGSYAKIANSSIQDIYGTAYMAYIKKNEYKGSRLFVTTTQLSNYRTLQQSTKKSKVYIDGRLEPAGEINVASLYQTGRMKKGK